MDHLLKGFHKELYKKSKTVVDNKTMTIKLIGDQYESTKDLSMGELKLFIERDIYLATCHQELPHMDYEISYSQNYGFTRGSLTVNIKHIDGEVFTPELGLQVKLKMVQIIIAYSKENYQFIDGCLLVDPKKICYTVKFSSNLEDEYIKKVEKGQVKKRSQLKFMPKKSFFLKKYQFIKKLKRLTALSTDLGGHQ